MNKRDYLLTANGAFFRYFYRYSRQIQSYCIEGEPKSKKTFSNEDKIKFQVEFNEQMKNVRRRSFRPHTKICVQIDAYINEKNPPHIQQIPKNYLDLLSKPIESNKIKRKRLLFDDDKQVSYLNVKYHVGSDKSSKIKFTLYPFRDLVEDIRLAYSFLAGDLEGTEYVSDAIDDTEILQDYGDYLSDFANELDKYMEFKRELKEVIDVNEIDVLSEEIHKQCVQERFLETQRLFITDMFWLLCLGINYEETINASLNGIYRKAFEVIGLERKDIFRLDLRALFKIKICEIPTRKNETKEFKKKIRGELLKFKKKNWFLDPLLVPVNLTVLYKPPFTHESGFYKDLDNIMKIVVPIFHEEFNPPVAYFQRRKMSKISAETQKYLNKIPQGLNYQILGYEIIEVPKETDDTGEGFLIVGICDTFYSGLLEHTHYVLSECHSLFKN